ncbi:MAG: 3-dehydroquinate synthase [Opitutales bacterium]
MTRGLQVELAERSYPIEIGPNQRGALRERLDELAGEGRRAAVVTDEHVARAQADFLAEACGGLPLLTLPAGETTKSVAHLETVYDFLAAQRMERSSVLVVVGGGVIGDLGGFAAATYLRGIDYIQIPTTLLAMVDSSVGGKTGINLKAGKNLAGAFHHPRAVFIDTSFLETLPEREFNAGMAEVIKYGMLADPDLFQQLVVSGRLRAGDVALPGVIRRCCEIKAEIVAADEKEQASSGGRALLNLGHTFAHAVEQVAGYGDYLHGEAVGLGLVMAARLSQERGTLTGQDVEVVRELVELYQLPIRLREPLPINRLAEAMKRDKKVRGGNLRFVGMDGIGRAATWNDVEVDLVVYLWKEFGACS